MNTTDRYDTARDALELAPDLIEHVAALIAAPTQPGPDVGVRVARVHAPAPLNVGALDTVSELTQRLAHWSDHWATALQTARPTADYRVDRFEWSATNPEAARNAALPHATWLLAHLDEIFRRSPDDVAYFVDELTEVHQAAIRYPMHAHPRYTQLQCRIRGCSGTVALWPFVEVKTWEQHGQHVFLPPEGARVRCDECGDRWSETEYNDEVRRLLATAKEAEKAAKVQQRLMKKYGPASSFPLFFGAVAGKVRHGHKQKMIGDTVKDLTKSPDNPVG